MPTIEKPDSLAYVGPHGLGLRTLGLIINPIAGIGGSVGLKGSDGAEVQRRALELGATPQSGLRTRLALEYLLPLKDRFTLLAASGPMGADLAREMGFSVAPMNFGVEEVSTTVPAGVASSGADSILAAQRMSALGVDLLLFAGGDGTARDIYAGAGNPEVHRGNPEVHRGNTIPVLGIPAGVKIHSAVFATHPRAAGEIAAALIRGEKLSMRESEVLDLDEESYRSGQFSTRLYGMMRVPELGRRLQNKKAPTPASEAVRAEAIAAAVVESMQPRKLYILGPGSTTRAIAEKLSVPKTLVGVDVVSLSGLVCLDANAEKLLQLTHYHPAKIILTPIGGQGFIFGRGNQQFTPQLIRRVGRENLILVSLAEKLNALKGAPLLVDSGDPQLDQTLTGYYPILTGYREKVMYRVSAG